MPLSTLRAASLTAVAALVASRSLGADSAPIITAAAAGQPWVWQKQSTSVGSGDVSVSFAATTSSGSADIWAISVAYEASNCTGTPVMVLADTDCSPYVDVADCAVADHFGSSSAEDDIPQVDTIGRCVTDLPSHLDQLFGSETYLRIDFFESSNCSEYYTTNAYVADGLCHAQIMTDGETKEAIMVARKTVISTDGTATTHFFNMTDCSNEPFETFASTEKQILASECHSSTNELSIIMYTNADLGGSKDADADSASSLTIGIVAGIICVCVAFLA